MLTLVHSRGLTFIEGRLYKSCHLVTEVNAHTLIDGNWSKREQYWLVVLSYTWQHFWSPAISGIELANFVTKFREVQKTMNMVQSLDHSRHLWHKLYDIIIIGRAAAKNLTLQFGEQHLDFMPFLGSNLQILSQSFVKSRKQWTWCNF